MFQAPTKNLQQKDNKMLTICTMASEVKLQFK